MSIYLDLVGLNTLVNEKIDTDTNTIGENSTRMIKFPFIDPGGSRGTSLKGTVPTDLFPTTGGISFSFWAKLTDPSTSGLLTVFKCLSSGSDSIHVSLYPSLSTPTFWVTVNDHSGNSKAYKFQVSQAEIGEFSHFLFTWDGNFEGNTALLYINGVERVTTFSTDSDPNTGNVRQIQDSISIGTKANGFGGLFGLLSNLCFISKKLSYEEVQEIYSNGFINDVRNTSVSSDIFLYFLLGTEKELSFISDGEDLPEQTEIKAIVGNVSVVTEGTQLPPSIIKTNKLVEKRNKKIATISSNDYFSALNIHRNGLYGYSTFNQIRTHQNPITRFHNKNSIFSHVSETGQARRTIRNERILSTHFDKYGKLTNYNEVPITFKNKPFEAVVNILIKDGEEEYDDKIVLSTPFQSQIQYFHNNSLNRELGIERNNHKNYSDIKRFYTAIDPTNSIIESIDSVKLCQTIFPTSLYATKNYVRQRPNFISGYWKDDRNERVELNQNNGFGHLIPSQSMWVLDTDKDFQNQGLQGNPGSFKIYGPSFATASTTKADAFGFHFPFYPASGIYLSYRDGAAIVTEIGDLGYNTDFIDFAERGSIGNIILSSHGSHLLVGAQAYWDAIKGAFQETYSYDSVEITETKITRKGLYLSDYGDLPSPSYARRFTSIQNIWRNTAAPAGLTETYRQHWFSCSVDCGLTYWNSLANYPTDAYHTLFFDISSSVDFSGIRSEDTISNQGNLSSIHALRRHVYYATSSVKLSDSNYTTIGRPRLVVRLGTKWFKNDGTIHYGNVPRSGAVEFFFDDIYTDNNPVGAQSSGTYYLEPILGRQQHFYLSLSQSMIAATLNPSGAVQLAINGEFMSASAVNDQWGFFNGPGHVAPGAHQAYTASSWTAADTGSIPTDVFWFSSGNSLTQEYLNEFYLSDIAVVSGCFDHNSLTTTQMNNKVKRFCGGVTGTESKTDGNTGLRFENYSNVCESLTELSGPILWYDFEKTHLNEDFGENALRFGVSSSNMQYGTHYDYSSSGDYTSGFVNIYGYVDSVPESLRLDNGSYANFSILPGSNFNTYVVTLSKSVDAAPKTIENFTSPDAAASPIGGSTGFNSFKGAGILQNSYSQFARSFSKTTVVDAQFSASCFYSRRHSLTGATTVVNPFFTNLSGGTIYPLISRHKFLGTAKWEAGDQAGFFDENGNFVSSSKKPFYNTYGEFMEEVRGVGKDYSIVPEFRINDHLDFFLSHGPLDAKNNFIELSGGLENLKNSSQDNFYKTYSNTEFLKMFDVVKRDHSKLFDPYRITLSCKAIKKFLPYDGFYPAQRTVQIAKQFYSSYGSNLTITSSGDYLGQYVIGNNYPSQYLLNPLFGPGVLFNTIKSGIACDYPVITSSMTTATNDDIEFYINDRFDQRIPFEALVEPEKHLANISLFSNEPDSLGNTQTEVLWNGQGDNNYKLQMNNFLAEVGDFFLENENYTTITSLPQGDPNFGNAEGDKVYSLRLKMYRTITGSKSPQEASNGIKFGVPQDTGNMGEGFTMYSRPSAFGPPTHFSSSFFKTKNWNVFKKENSVDFSYKTGSTYTAVTSSGANNGFNYPFTPPYYHGEAWADITFVPPEGTKKYTLPEIINNSSVEFCRYYNSGSSQFVVSSSTKAQLKIKIDGVISSAEFIGITASNGSLFLGITGSITTSDTTFTSNQADINGTSKSQVATDLATLLNSVDGYSATVDSTTVSPDFFVVMEADEPARFTHDFGPLVDAATGINGAASIRTPGGITNGIEPFDVSTVVNNDMAMQIASSMNIFSKGVLRQDITNAGNVTVDTQFENKYRWIMQSKFECPTLNFNHHSHDTITMPNIATSSVPIGMWHQYGRLPQSTDEGIFIQVEEVPRNWTEGALNRDFDATGSLLNLCGFSTDPVRVGEIKESKIIEEAVVAIPFVADRSKNRFFKINKKDAEAALNNQESKVGDTISDLVKQLRKYVFPPQFDFVSFKDVDPVVMYVFEFSHKLSKQDLADIWQNLPPSIGNKQEVVTSTFSHDLFSQEFFGRGAILNNQGDLQKITRLSDINTDLQWMVFKVKKRARNNYFEKMFERNESGADVTSDEIVATATGRKQKLAYNWPYDFFSLIELIKIDAEVEFGNVDSGESQRLNDTILFPTPPIVKS